MKAVVERGLSEAREEFARRQDDGALHDLEVEADFWVRVEECEHCSDGQLCSSHYERMVMCL